MKTEINITPEDFTQVNCNNNGHPRFVCHFLRLTTSTDDDQAGDGLGRVSNLYRLALNKAKNVNGKKFHNKQYGGGIVFVSWNIQDTCKEINEKLNK